MRILGRNFALAALAIGIISSAANAATVHSYSFSATDTEGGQSVTVTAFMSIESTATAGTYKFTLANTSGTTGGTSDGVLTGFALDFAPSNATPTITNDFVGETGTDQDWFIHSISGNSLSNSIGFDVCYTSQSNGSCTGAGNANVGLQSGETSMFLIAFSPDVSFSNALTRFQSIGPNGGSQKIVGSDCQPGALGCAPNTTSTPVPLPAGLPLMLTAIGIGAYMRKRARKSA
ncbi:hypothetical protein [Tateyamaria sp.]|uniref:hypothetical protein n=1 Tax=Tateyamaria sp. TaxID=1929288 RepID=UPI0032A03426